MLDKYFSFYTERQLKRKEKRERNASSLSSSIEYQQPLKKSQTLGSETCIFS